MADIESLVKRLRNCHVDFVVIGGIAAAAQGASFVTGDLDVCCRFSPENIQRLGKAIGDLHPVHRMTPDKLPVEFTPEKCCGMRNLYIATDWGQLDCLSEVAGIGDYDAVEKESVEIELAGRPCRILGLDALIRSKEAMGTQKDRLTVIQLKAIRERLQQNR